MQVNSKHNVFKDIFMIGNPMEIHERNEDSCIAELGKHTYEIIVPKFWAFKKKYFDTIPKPKE